MGNGRRYHSFNWVNVTAALIVWGVIALLIWWGLS